MKESIFKLKAGKEVPARHDGLEIRYMEPESVQEFVREVLKLPNVTVTFSGEGADKAAEVTKDVLLEGFHLNHRQKPAKRAAAKEGSTLASITKEATDHVPAVRSARAASGTGQVSATRSLIEDLIKDKSPEEQARIRERMAAIRKPKAKKAAEPATAEAAAPAPKAKK